MCEAVIDKHDSAPGMLKMGPVAVFAGHVETS